MINVYDRWPRKLVVGTGAVKEQLPKEIEEFGAKKAFVITDSSLSKLPFISEIVENLKASGIDVCLFGEVRPQPTVKNVEDAVAAAKAFGAEILVSVGGGSSMDCARMINGVFTYGGEVSEHSVAKKIKYHRVEMLPHIAIPTTAGTGGEIAGGGAVYGYDEATGNEIEIGIGDANLVPDVAIIDPEMTKSLPAYATAYTGMDALTHAIECLYSTKKLEAATGLALEAISIIKEYLPISVHDGANEEARLKMLIAANMATMAFSQTRLGLCHSMAMSLSVLGGVAHGVGNALLLPHIVKFNGKACPEITKRIAVAMGIESDDPVQAVADYITGMLRDINLPEYLDDERVKFDPSKLDEASEVAKACGFTATNPINPTVEEIKSIFEGCYSK